MESIAKLLGEITGYLLGEALGALLLMVAWNFVSSSVFHSSPLTFLQSFALLFIFNFFLALISNRFKKA